MTDILSSADLSSQTRQRAIMALSAAFMLDEVTNGVGGLESRDAILVLAINQANIAPLTRDPEARARYGGLDSPAPDEERRPVSLSAVASSLRLPYETVRRRVRRLEGLGVCAVSSQGAIVPETFLASPAYLSSVLAAHVRLHGFYQQLREARLLEALPASRYPPEPSVPVRASLRPISDYVLRLSEGLMGLTGDLIRGLTFLALLSAALERRSPACSTAQLARRVGMPHETVRRHVAELAGMGLCARSGRGHAVTEPMLGRPEFAELMADNAANVQRLFAGLAERGIIEAWERLGCPGARTHG